MLAKTLAFSLIFALTPALLAAQTLGGGQPAPARNSGPARLTLEGAAGLTLQRGDVQSASAGFSPVPWLTLLVQGERFHVPTRVSYFQNGSSISRGFTTLVLGGEVRVTAPMSARVSVYTGLGMGAGRWGSNVNEHFQRRDRGPVRAVYLGGGVRVRMRGNLSAVVDARLAIAGGGESVIGYVPIRGGLAWDF